MLGGGDRHTFQKKLKGKKHAEKPRKKNGGKGLQPKPEDKKRSAQPNLLRQRKPETVSTTSGGKIWWALN